MNTKCYACCNSPEHAWHPNRREFLFVGLLGSLGLTLGNVLKLRAESASIKASAQSVINVFLPGGIAAQESFDPKLLAPIEYRGPLSTVKTKLSSTRSSIKRISRSIVRGPCGTSLTLPIAASI